MAILGVFKYYDFFAESLQSAIAHFGYDLDFATLNLVLPVGISFYTFQALSYTIDVYRGKIKATHDPVEFFAFISFFLQLVAGPIERATNLLPQFQKNREFDYSKAVDGCRQMLWGFFKKIVVADTCASVVNQTMKVPKPMLVTLSGMMTFVSFVQFLKALSWITATVLGITTLVISEVDLQSANIGLLFQPLPRETTLCPSTISGITISFSLPRYLIMAQSPGL